VVDIRWSEIFPDDAQLLARQWFKDPSLSASPITAPSGATFIRISGVASGPTGGNGWGNGAFSHSKRRCIPGEVFDVYIGPTPTGSPQGDAWVRRRATGEVIMYADRGKGGPITSHGTDGQASACIGDWARSGDHLNGSGSDAGDVAPFGFGGRYCAGQDGTKSAQRSAQPGSGGRDGGYQAAPGAGPTILGGPGCIVVEFYNGDPGAGY